ncbi:hypothetical protein POM88_018384 [Heracleum sosnowskyi]|uniref:Uncharacterized protein n=1 Tax=Heracleum sosnowskyi TaxID=360622 RepID=A0AAD8ISS8_9APIA|nr:hypothetical protein POM88_018384 [Heracleum sosnowskyi]
MAPKQSISQTNFAGIYSPSDADRIENVWETAVAQEDGDISSIQFKIKEHGYSLTVQGINAALGIVLEPGKDYAELASDETLKKLFLKIGYSGPILEEGTTKWYPSGEMDRKEGKKEAIQALSDNLDAANLPKAEKGVRSESQQEESGRERSGKEGFPKQDVAQGEPVSKEASRSEGETVRIYG